MVMCWIAILYTEKFSGYVFMLIEMNLQVNQVSDFFFLQYCKILNKFSKIYIYSQIPLSQCKAQQHVFLCSEDFVLPKNQNPQTYLLSCELALHWALLVPWFQSRWCSSGTHVWLVLSGSCTPGAEWQSHDGMAAGGLDLIGICWVPGLPGLPDIS